jgi:NAD-dependent deacetylase
MALEDQIALAGELLAKSRRTVALTGAGISTPSGIPDFRSPSSGLWNSVDPVSVASVYAFRRRPQDFYDWIHPIARQTLEAEPNGAHLALAQLEEYGPLQAVITQNVDMLHGKAGSRNVYEVHGHLRELTCLRCYSVYSSDSFMQTFMNTGEMPCCEKCGGVLKPNVILFGEQLPVRVFNEARKQVQASDLLLVVGSSLETAPVADLPMLAYKNGARLIIVNHESTHVDHLADVVIDADVVDVLSELVGPFLSK